MPSTFYGHSYWYTSPELWAKLRPLAQQMRHEPTPAEKLLWQHLRIRQVKGIKFRRQFPVERFIVDFICVKQHLVVEVDGPIHDYTPEQDAIRQAFIESLGIRVLRFSNDEVLGDARGVAEKIAAAVER